MLYLTLIEISKWFSSARVVFVFVFEYAAILEKPQFVCRGPILWCLLWVQHPSRCLFFVLKGDHFHYLLGRYTKPAPNQELVHPPPLTPGSQGMVYPRGLRNFLEASGDLVREREWEG